MKLAPQSGDILRQYKALINARRRDAGQGEPLPLPAARKPWQAAPAGERRRRASGATHSPLRCQSLLPGNTRIIRDIFL